MRGINTYQLVTWPPHFWVFSRPPCAHRLCEGKRMLPVKSMFSVCVWEHYWSKRTPPPLTFSFSCWDLVSRSAILLWSASRASFSCWRPATSDSISASTRARSTSTLSKETKYPWESHLRHTWHDCCKPKQKNLTPWTAPTLSSSSLQIKHHILVACLFKWVTLKGLKWFCVL